MTPRPDPSTVALLTIDVQADFVRRSGSSYVEGTEEVLPAMRRTVEAFRAAGRPIVHVVRLYIRDGSNAELSRIDLVRRSPGIVAPHSVGSELDPAVAPSGGDRLDPDALLGGALQQLGPAEWALYKPRWGAFFETSLHQELRALGVEGLALVGTNFSNCPRATLVGATERDYPTLVVSDAVSRLDARGLDECAGLGVGQLTSIEIQDWLQSAFTHHPPHPRGR